MIRSMRILPMLLIAAFMGPAAFAARSSSTRELTPYKIPHEMPQAELFMPVTPEAPRAGWPGPNMHVHRHASWFMVIMPGFGFMVLLASLVCVMAILRRQRRSHRDQARQVSDEAAILQRIWQGLDRMEQRADNLETILMRPESGPMRG